MHVRRISAAAGAALVALALAGCQAPDAEPPGDGDVTTPTPEETAEPTDEPTDPATDATDAADDALVQAAVADLAGREEADAADVEPGTLEHVTWPDGSLGCPQPGQAYTQALVEGTRLVLVLDGTEYAYHGAAEGALEYCAEPGDPVPSDDATG